METKKIKLPSGKIAEVKEYLTGFDVDEIAKTYSNLVEKVGDKIKLGDARSQATRLTIEKAIVSIDGKTDDIVNRVYGLKAVDFIFLREYTDELFSGGKDFLGGGRTPGGGIV
jgi:hypothetical protein